MKPNAKNNKIRAFVERWTNKGYEKGQSQIFWTELLTDVLGVETPSDVISFEDQVKLDHTAFIDAYMDRAVMVAYGFPVKNFTESDCVAKLLEMYKELTK